MTEEILVGIIGDEPLASRAARALRRAAIPLVAEANDIDDFVRRCADRRPHVAVQASRVPADGPPALRRLAAGIPRTRLVTIIPTADRALVRAALAAGADGVLTAAQVPDALALTVRSVWLGQTSIPRAANNSLERPALSHREQEVLDLVGTGLSNAQIAARLCVTEHTVKSHLSSLFSKLGVHSRTEAIAAHAERPQPGTAGPHVHAGSPRTTEGALA